MYNALCFIHNALRFVHNALHYIVFSALKSISVGGGDSFFPHCIQIFCRVVIVIVIVIVIVNLKRRWQNWVLEVKSVSYMRLFLLFFVEVS